MQFTVYKIRNSLFCKFYFKQDFQINRLVKKLSRAKLRHLLITQVCVKFLFKTLLKNLKINKIVFMTVVQFTYFSLFFLFTSCYVHFYNDYILVRHLCLIYRKFLVFLTFNKLRPVYHNSDVYFKWQPCKRLVNNKVFYYSVRAFIK